MLRPLLFLSSLIGAFAYSAGAGTSTVVADFSTIDAGSMPQPKYQTSGPFVCDPDTLSYSSNVAKSLSIYGESQEPIAGVLGYFGDANNNKVGVFTATSNVLQTSWQTLTTGQAFTHADTPTYGNSQTMLSIDWTFNIWKSAPALPGAEGTSFDFTATPLYTGDLYWTVQPSTDAEPSADQVVAGEDADGNPAFLSGDMPMTANTQVSVHVSGLTGGASFNLFVVGSASTPDLYFYAYILHGIRDPSNTGVQFYRMWHTDSNVTMITPSTDPLLTTVSALPFTAAAAALRPVMWLGVVLAVLARML